MCAILIAASSSFAKIEKRYPKDDSPHYLYLPDKIDPDKTYWVVVGVHGAGGGNRGAKGIAGWVDKKDNVIVLGPKFGKTYQNAYPEDQKILLDLFAQLQKEYKVHPKMFIYGFSGGAQFSHRFVMLQPDYVCGVSSHSGGSWATDGFGKMSDDAKHIPFAISCGAKDTGKAWGEAPYGRLEWFKRFDAEMEKQGFFYKSAIFEDAGHGASPGIWTMTEECFQLATRGILPDSDLAKKLAEIKVLGETGQFDAADRMKRSVLSASLELPKSSGWRDSKESLDARKELLQVALAETDTSSAARQRYSLYQRCVELLKSANPPDAAALSHFIQQCPPSYWHGRPDSQLVFDACNKAAAAHVESLRTQKRLNMQAYKALIPVYRGLDTGAALLEEYDARAQLALDKILAGPDGVFKQRALKTFVDNWQIGPAVERARSALQVH
jgi:hypothetical protein